MYPREIETSVQMRLYTLSKRHFVLVFLAFFLSFGISIIIGFTGPALFESSNQNVTSLTQLPSDLRKGPFKMRTPSLTVFNQQLWLKMKLIRHPVSGDSKARLVLPFDLGVEILGISGQQKGKGNLIYGPFNRSRELKCDMKSCDELLIFHLGSLDFPAYFVTITLHGLNSKYLQVDDVIFSFSSYSAYFTHLEIWFRFCFLVLAFVATCIFAHSMRRFLVRDWSIEQRWMSMLLPLLLLYNDPLLALSFLVKSWIPGVLDAVFQATFLCALLLFWLCIYHGVRQNERHFSSFYLPKLIVVGVIWLSAVSLASWQALAETSDPTYNYLVDSGNILVFKVILGCIGGVYVLYFVYLLVRAYAELRTMPYFNVRLKFLTCLMVLVLIISVAIMALRLGSGVLQGTWDLGPQQASALQFTALYGLLNSYLLTMAYVYAPSKNAQMESHFKDNPAVSMLNDSDEDVLYGSDYEDASLMADVRSK